MPNLVSKVPFDKNGNMIRRTARYNSNNDPIIWIANGPIKTTLKFNDIGYTCNSHYFSFIREDTDKEVYMFFDDFVKIVMNKPVVDKKLTGTWIFVGHAGTYGISLHPSDPDYVE